MFRIASPLHINKGYLQARVERQMARKPSGSWLSLRSAPWRRSGRLAAVLGPVRADASASIFFRRAGRDGHV